MNERGRFYLLHDFLSVCLWLSSLPLTVLPHVQEEDKIRTCDYNQYTHIIIL
jgi:hypothetical protein